MKTIFILISMAIVSYEGIAQEIPFKYSVNLKPINIPNLPGLHSFAVAQSKGKWLVIGGRKDGLHARQPFNAFTSTGNNTDIIVIDIEKKLFWSASVNSLPTGLKEQLQSTNMNFYQDEDTLIIIGGYGYSNTAQDHITFPNLTTVSISGVIQAVINSTSISPYFKQISDQNFAVNGGQLGKINNTFYLVGGHRFDGRYNPMGNPTYTQTYVNGIKKFVIHNSGSQLNYSNFNTITDQVHLHRRDYNLLPQIFPNGEQGYTISSGVFQTDIDLPFLYPIDITENGYTPQPGFNQYLSNYHSAKTALYDSVSNTMHSIFFGGISQYTYVNNVLTADNNVPFVKTISRVSRDKTGKLQENLLSTEMPAYIGASAEFILNHQIPHYTSEITKLHQLNSDSTLLGYILGGIYSPQINPFTNNQTSVTNALNTIYEVWLHKNNFSNVITLNGENPYKVEIIPNPSKSNINLQITLPSKSNLLIMIMDTKGEIIHTESLAALSKGQQMLSICKNNQLSNGLYTVNIVFDGKFSTINKLSILE